jgi:uncharacterized membrane protein YidH (DUF202 family)
MSSAAERRRDPGLAPERTSMTWQRTALGFISLGALTLGAAAHRNTPWIVLPAAALFAVGAAIALYWRRRVVDEVGGAHPRALRWLAVAAAAAAAVAAALTIVHPG